MIHLILGGFRLRFKEGATVLKKKALKFENCEQI